jgi:hypothetical protein
MRNEPPMSRTAASECRQALRMDLQIARAEYEEWNRRYREDLAIAQEPNADGTLAARRTRETHQRLQAAITNYRTKLDRFAKAVLEHD